MSQAKSSSQHASPGGLPRGRRLLLAKRSKIRVREHTQRVPSGRNKITFAKLIASPEFRKVLNSVKWRRWKAKHQSLLAQLPDRRGKRGMDKLGQPRWAIDYMMKHPCKFVNQGDLMQYCDKRLKENPGYLRRNKSRSYHDNSRGVEKLRRDMFPGEFVEVSPKYGDHANEGLFFVFCPFIKEHMIDAAWERQKHKKDGFSKEQIKFAYEKANFKCEITGLPASEGKLAADHWFPKEKGGKSEQSNCVILNKILNEKKNNHTPLTWFTKHLLTNFLNICQRMGNLDEIKEGLIAFIQEF